MITSHDILLLPHRRIVRSADATNLGRGRHCRRDRGPHHEATIFAKVLLELVAAGRGRRVEMDVDLVLVDGAEHLRAEHHRRGNGGDGRGVLGLGGRRGRERRGGVVLVAAVPVGGPLAVRGTVRGTVEGVTGHEGFGGGGRSGVAVVVGGGHGGLVGGWSGEVVVVLVGGGGVGEDCWRETTN